MRRRMLWVMFGLAIFGIADATLLTIMHYSNLTSLCFASGGCDLVNKSIYAEFFHVPMAVWGILMYLTVAVLCLCRLQNWQLPLPIQVDRVLAAILAAALLVSAYLVYLQFFVLKNICFYCMISAGNVLLLNIVNFSAGRSVLKK